jgi:hypothetical protein
MFTQTFSSGTNSPLEAAMSASVGSGRQSLMAASRRENRGMPEMILQPDRLGINREHRVVSCITRDIHALTSGVPRRRSRTAGTPTERVCSARMPAICRRSVSNHRSTCRKQPTAPGGPQATRIVVRGLKQIVQERRRVCMNLREHPDCLLLVEAFKVLEALHDRCQATRCPVDVARVSCHGYA